LRVAKIGAKVESYGKKQVKKLHAAGRDVARNVSRKRRHRETLHATSPGNAAIERRCTQRLQETPPSRNISIRPPKKEKSGVP